VTAWSDRISDALEAWLAPWGAALVPARLRAYAFVIAGATWFAYILHFAVPALHPNPADRVAGDFYYFYTLGALALDGRGAALYDAAAQGADCAQRLAGVIAPCDMPPSVYGPQLAIALMPIATLPYYWALGVWLLGVTAICGVCSALLWRAVPQLRGAGPTVAALTLGSPAFFYLIAFGQTTAPALACFTAAYLALAKDRPLIAGLAIGTLAYKPSLGIACAVVFTLAGEWTVVIGAAAAAAVQLGVAAWCVGPDVLRAYAQSIAGVGYRIGWFEPKPYHMHSLRAFFEMLVPWPALSLGLYLVAAALVLWWTLRAWKRPGPLALRFSLVLLATVLVDPHLHAYDMVVLMPAFFLLGGWAIERWGGRTVSTIAALTCALYLLPLVGPLAMLIRVQLSVIAAVSLLLMIPRASTSELSSTT
jgi:hypothetical protein